MTTGRRRGLFAGALAAAALVRLGTWPSVSRDGWVSSTAVDGFYHLRRAFLIAEDFPHVPQTDELMSVPTGAMLQWPPLFDMLLALVGLLFGGGEAGLERAGSVLPVVLGLIEVAMVGLVASRLLGQRSAIPAAWCAALLPGVAAFSLLGQLDHDSLIEIGFLLALAGLAGAAHEPQSKHRYGFEVAVGLAMLVLTWAGSPIYLGLLGLLGVVFWLQGSSGACRALAVGGFVAAVGTVPVVAASVWTLRQGAAFEGLSLLHSQLLFGLAALGAAGVCVAGPRSPEGDWTRPRWDADVHRSWLALLGLALATTLVLLAWVLPAFVEGLRFLGRSEPFLQEVAESRPLFFLLGSFDLKPALVRLSIVPLVGAVLLLSARAHLSAGGLVAAVWAGYAILVGVVQARYTHSAAIAVCVLFALMLQVLRRSGASRVGLLCCVLFAPCAAGYVALPGFDGLRMYGRPDILRASGYAELFDYLRSQPPSAAWLDPEAEAEDSVLAPWTVGHWLQWIGRQATVVGPFGPQGQPEFNPGVALFVEEDPGRFAAGVERHRVRWIAVRAHPPAWQGALRMARRDPSDYFGVDPATGREYLQTERLLRVVTFGLAFGSVGETNGRLAPHGLRLEEVARSSRAAVGPLGEVPLTRLYEVHREGEPLPPARASAPSSVPGAR